MSDVATGGPKRLRLARRAGFRLPQGAKRVDRATSWGNPFRLDGEAAGLLARGIALAHGRDMKWARVVGAVSLFRLWLGGRLNELPAAVRAAAEAELAAAGWPLPPGTQEIRDALAGQDLACWCGPNDPCHADVLLEIANPAMEFELAEGTG